MTLNLGTDLWDKQDAIIAFSENNTIIVDRLQKIIGELCKSQLSNAYSQKKLFEKFLGENDALKKSELNFSKNVYFLSEQMIDIINAQETFSDSLLNEVDEIIKIKTANIKKESKIIKNEKKRLFDDLSKENQKLDSDFKRYRLRFNNKDCAYLASIKAEENKALSRNQVDNFQSIYLSRKAQYEDGRTEYIETLETFNNYQKKYYSTLIGEWGTKVQNIENERYNILKATFTNLAELCKSIASKFNKIAERIELRTDTIECVKDCVTLINQEKTGDVPPGDVPFKDFDIDVKNEVFNDEARTSKISNNSGSDSTSSNNDNKNFSNFQIQKTTRSLRRCSTGVNSDGNGSVANGLTTGGSKFFGKLFGGSKKTKESSVPIIQSKIQNLESLIEEKCAHKSEVEHPEECDEALDTMKSKLESLKEDYCEIKKSDSKKKRSIFRSMRQYSYNDPSTSVQKSRSIFKKCGRSLSNQFENHRSKSISTTFSSHPESINQAEQIPSAYQKKPKITLERKISKPKLGPKPNARSQTMQYNNREQVGGGRVRCMTIEAVLPVSPVEIVSTPAEALAIVARESVLLSSLDHDNFPEVKEDNISNIENIVPETKNDSYEYYYVGSCVAVHDYEGKDLSKMILSFFRGQQFYIIQEDNTIDHIGWLLVETIDKSQSGYVPSSFMETRLFATSVRMVSDHPIPFV